jgi:hypothetical protein
VQLLDGELDEERIRVPKLSINQLGGILLMRKKI